MVQRHMICYDEQYIFLKLETKLRFLINSISPWHHSTPDKIYKNNVPTYTNGEKLQK